MPHPDTRQGGRLIQREIQPRAVDPNAAWHIYVVFDGGSLGNPGKGYGSYVYKGVVNEPEPVQITYPGKTTNNEAEYLTLINALESAIAAVRSNGRDPAQLRIAVKTDSKLVVEQVCGRWKVKKAELRPLVQKAQTLLNQFASWTLSWHPRSESVRILGH